MMPIDLGAWSAVVGPFDDRHYCGKDVTVADVKRAVAVLIRAAHTDAAALAFITTAMAAGRGDDLPTFAAKLRAAAERWRRVEPLIEPLRVATTAVTDDAGIVDDLNARFGRVLALEAAAAALLAACLRTEPGGTS